MPCCTWKPKNALEKITRRRQCRLLSSKFTIPCGIKCPCLKFPPFNWTKKKGLGLLLKFLFAAMHAHDRASANNAALNALFGILAANLCDSPCFSYSFSNAGKKIVLPLLDKFTSLWLCKGWNGRQQQENTLSLTLIYAGIRNTSFSTTNCFCSSQLWTSLCTSTLSSSVTTKAAPIWLIFWTMWIIHKSSKVFCFLAKNFAVPAFLSSCWEGVLFARTSFKSNALAERFWTTG